jgi:hypothetical protein
MIHEIGKCDEQLELMSADLLPRPPRAKTLENVEGSRVSLLHNGKQYANSVNKKKSALSSCEAVIKVSHPLRVPSISVSHRKHKVRSFAGGLRVLRTDTEARLPRAGDCEYNDVNTPWETWWY